MMEGMGWGGEVELRGLGVREQGGRERLEREGREGEKNWKERGEGDKDRAGGLEGKDIKRGKRSTGVGGESWSG